MIHPDILKELVQLHNVSETEFAVLHLVIDGKPMAEIAAELKIDAAAARKRLGEVYRKFGIGGKGPGKLAKLQSLLIAQSQGKSRAILAPQRRRATRPENSPTDSFTDSATDGLSEVTAFYGRSEELAELEQLLQHDYCQLIELIGANGIGKTALVRILAKQISSQFEQVLYYPLSRAPALKDLLADLLQNLVGEAVGVTASDSISRTETQDRLSRLLAQMQQRRCLIILDGAETLLRSDALAGCYRDEYQDYALLLKQIAETEHQSCLVLTSSEKTQDFAALETKKVRAFHLSGLKATEGNCFFKDRDIFAESESDWSEIVRLYGGNPLVLKLAAVTIQEVFGGSLSDFLQQGTAVFGDIRNLLEQQFSRLSKLERDILYWLAIACEPVSLLNLRQDMVPAVAPPRLLEALESLSRRSLVEQHRSAFSLQPVVMEYLAGRLVERMGDEILAGRLRRFNHHVLIKAEAKDYIREQQIRLLLRPLLEKLMGTLEHESTLKQKLLQCLAELRQQTPLKPGYAAGNVLNLLREMGVSMQGCDFSALTVRQAYLKDVELHDVSFAGADLAGSVFAEKLGSILSIAFSPDGKLLAMGDTDSNIRLWNVVTGEQVATWQGHEDWVRSVMFSPDSQLLVSGSEDQTLRLWDVVTGQCQKILTGHRSWVRSVAFSPDGKLLASSSDDWEVRLWNLTTGVCLHTLTYHTNVVRSVAFSPDGQLLASGSSDRTVRLWNVATGDCLRKLEQHTRGVCSVAFSPDGRLLASGSTDQKIRLWDVATGNCLQSLIGHRSWVWSVVFSKDGQLLASGSEDQTVRLWQVKTGECLKVLRGHTSWVRSVAFSPNGQLLASGSEDQTVRIWDVQSRERIKTLQGYARGIRSVAFSPDGCTLASGSEDQTVRLWDVATEQCLSTLKHSGRVWSVAFSPDGRMLASGSEDRQIRLWQIGTGVSKVFSGHGDSVLSVAFSPDGQTLVSSGSDQTIRLWDVLSGQCLGILAEHNEWVWSVAFSPDGATLASGGSDLKVKLWHVKTQQCLATLEGHHHWIRSVVFSPDGQTLASSSVGRTVRLWDVKTGQPLGQLDGFKNGIRSVAFSPDSQILASGSDDRVVRLWDIQSGRCLQSLQGHSDRIKSVVFSADGKFLASGSNDETIKIWDVATGAELKNLRLPRLYEGMNITNAINLTPTQQVTLLGLGAVDQNLLL